MYGYRKETFKYTIAIVSYTPHSFFKSKKPERVKEEKVKVNGVSFYNKYELKKYLEKNHNMDKVFVHEIKETYYWEE